MVDPADADPLPGAPAGAAIELRDGETGEVVTVTLTPGLRRRYRERFEARCAGLSARCAAAGVRYIRADTTTPAADLLFSWRRQGSDRARSGTPPHD